MKSATRSACIIVTLAVALVATTLNASVLRRGTNSELPSLDPQYAIGNSAGAIMYELFEGLVGNAPDGSLIPAVAESWTISEDGTIYTFKLDPKAKWSDGKKITAEDFIYSYKRMLDPRSGTRGSSSLFPVLNARDISLGRKPLDTLGVKALAPDTLEITLTRPAPYFIDLLASYTNAPVPGHVIEKYQEKWTQPENMVTNGAYKVAEVITNTYYRLVKNINYKDVDQVSIDEVYYYPVPSDTTSLKRFLAGELDVILNIPTNQYQTLQRERPDEFHLAPGIGLGYLLVNNTKPPFDDVRVRKALSLSIDRDIIVDKLLRTGDDPAYSVIPNSVWESPSPLPAYASQPQQQRWAEARRLLKEAGFDKSNPLKFTLNFSPIERDRRLAVAYRSMWKQAGIQVEMETQGVRDLMKRAAIRDYQVMRLTYYPLYSDPTAFLTLVKDGSFRNYSGYSNPVINERLDIADTILSPEERAAYLRETEKLVMNDFPVVPIYYKSRAFLVSERVQGWTDSYAPQMAKNLRIKE